MEEASRGPSIIVLPFENLSGEPTKAYVAGGLTEEILAAVAQFEDLFVYARETGVSYGSGASYEDLHRELGVRYVLQGSVREAEGRIRVTARLADATKEPSCGHPLTRSSEVERICSRFKATSLGASRSRSRNRMGSSRQRTWRSCGARLRRA